MPAGGQAHATQARGLKGVLVISANPELDAVRALLASADLPTEDITEAHCRDFFYAGPRDAPTGLVGLEVLGDVALLRSLVVTPADRNAGEGSELVRHAEDQARRRGVRGLYLLTMTAEKFFAKRGYGRVLREAAPTAIKATKEFAGICPSSSAFMSKLL
jgi:amino-acid N-acetyltransferase